MRTSLLCVMLVSFFLFASVESLAAEKHPRVAELESLLAKDASDFLKGRFPSVPFLVNVAVEPLRRQTSKETGEGENLPYMRYRSEEIQDEWDDPNRSIYELISRSRKINVNVSVPDNLKDSEVSDLKESMIQVLNLTPGRDEIQVKLRDWSKGPAYLQWALGITGAILLLGLVSLLFVRSILNKMTNTIRMAGESKSAPAPAAAAAPPNPGGDSRSPVKGVSGDVTVSDPIRVRKALTEGALFLAKDPLFPTLEDMIVMDELGRENASVLGAFLIEFPVNLQSQIFSYSKGHHWMDAFVAPGDVSARSLEVAQRLARTPRAGTERHLEDLFIALWRLDKDLVSFLKELDVEVAFSLLYKLPKGLALSAARKAFPGTWGRLLDPKFKPVAISTEDAKVYLKKVAAHKPWAEFSQLDAYKHDKELLKYLSFADPAEERDIYEASASDSFIHSVRPPFYKIFDLSEEALKTVVPQISLDQWALALFNIDRPSRRRVEMHLSEKQRFVLIERLKGYDQSAPRPEVIGQARENIGRIYQQVGEQSEPAKTEIDYEDLLSSTQNAA